MKITITTPPMLLHDEGQFWVEMLVPIGAQMLSVRAPVGDGRYLAERVHQMIVAPAIAPRPLDPIKSA